MKKTTMDEGRAVPIRPLFKALVVSHLLCDLGMIAVPLCASLCLPLPSGDWTGNDLPGPFHLCDRYAFRGSLLLDLFSQTNANMFFSVTPSLISPPVVRRIMGIIGSYLQTVTIRNPFCL